MNTIGTQELLDKGIIQEVNRLFLHPRGMALAVSSDDETNESKLIMLDDRDDDTGFYYPDGVITQEKKKHCLKLHESKVVHRVNNLGYVVQAMD